MSLLRKSETKHVVTKTQKVSTPPKYLQSMSSSKGVRSTSYVHRTFVDAEAKVGKTDARFSGMTNPQLKTLLKALGVKKPTGNKEDMQNLIVEKLAPNVLKETLKDIKKSRLNAIYKFVSGKTFDYGDSTDEEIEAELTKLISLEIKGRPKTKINNFVNQTPAATNTQQNKTKQDSGKTKEQIVEAMPGMPGAVGANPKADTIEKGRRKVKNNETFFTMKNGVTKLYKKISKNKSERLLPPDTTPPAPIAATKTTKTTKTTAKSQGETKQDSGKTKEQIVEAMPGMPGAVGANPKADTIEKGRRKVKNNETFFTMKNGVTKLYKKISKNKSERLLPPDTTPPAPTAKTTKTTAPKQTEGKTEGKTEGETKEAAPTEEELLQKKYEIFRKFFGELVTKDFKASKKLAQVMAQLKNNDKPKIKQMLKNLNAIITRIAIGGGQFQNGQRIALLVDKLDNEDKSISFKEMKSALRNNANKKKGKDVFKDDFIPLKQILFKDMHFKNFSELLIFMDSDKDGKLSIIEFANMYLRAKLTQALERDINENFIDETYTEMLKLFGIGDETPPAPQKNVSPPQTTFEKGDIVISKEKPSKDKGLIGEINETTAHVFWEDVSDDKDNKLTDLVKVTISNDTESKIQEIFKSYDTKRTDGTLDDGEARKSLLDNIKASKVYSTLDQFNVDGIAGFSREEFRFLLTVRPKFIENWDKKQSQRKRMQARADSEQEGAKQMQEWVAREKLQQEQAKQKAKQDEIDAAIVNQKLERQAKQKEEEDDQKFIVKLTADGTFSVTQNTAYRDYKKKLDDIPKTACKPETTTNN